MRAAAGPALSEAVKGRQIALGWLQAGADLQTDILPVIKARAAGKPPRSIVSWRYFHHAVAEAYQRRTGRTLKTVDNGALGQVAQHHLRLMRVVGR